MYKIFTLIFIVTSSLFANDPTPLHPPVAKEAKIDWEQLKKEASSAKAECVAQYFGEQNGYSLFGISPSVALLPHTQELTFSTLGELCHVGYYADVIVYTILSGPDYGYQVIQAYNGLVLSAQYAYFLDSTPSGLYLRHEYLDVTIVTGTDQVVYFK